MATKTNGKRYLIFRSVLVSASILGFLPLFGLMKQAANSPEATASSDDAPKQAVAAPAADTGSTNSASNVSQGGSVTTQSAAPSSRSTTATHTRTKAS